MNRNKPTTRTEAAEPAATRHLHEGQKKALDVAADAEHSGGEEREKATREIEKLASTKPPRTRSS